jgi:hypothetical protein
MMPPMKNLSPDSMVALADAVDRLSHELRIVREVPSNIGEDLDWIVRDEKGDDQRQHSVLKEMALDPDSDGWRLSVSSVRHSKVP